MKRGRTLTKKERKAEAEVARVAAISVEALRTRYEPTGVDWGKGRSFSFTTIDDIMDLTPRAPTPGRVQVIRSVDDLVHFAAEETAPADPAKLGA